MALIRIYFLLGKANLTVHFSPAKLVYGENVTVSAEGVWPATLSRGRYTITVWYEDIQDPIYKASNPWNLKYLRPGLRHYFNHKKGEFVKVVFEYPIYFHGGAGVMPRHMFTSGWYRVQGKFYNEYDEEFLCLEISAYWIL